LKMPYTNTYNIVPRGTFNKHPFFSLVLKKSFLKAI
jgi:hypothetical protein